MQCGLAQLTQIGYTDCVNCHCPSNVLFNVQRTVCTAVQPFSVDCASLHCASNVLFDGQLISCVAMQPVRSGCAARIARIREAS